MNIVYDAKRQADSSILKLKKRSISLQSVDPQALLLWGGEFKPQSLNNPQTQHQWRGDADLYTGMHTHLFIYLNIYLFISGAVQQREGG